jgi:hypothetical protein
MLFLKKLKNLYRIYFNNYYMKFWNSWNKKLNKHKIWINNMKNLISLIENKKKLNNGEKFY